MKIISYTLLILTILSVGSVFTQDKPRGITVTGVGVATALPDRVELNVNIFSRDDKAVKALELNNKLLGKVLELLKESAIPDTNITTSSFRIGQDQDYSDQARSKWTYSASCLLKIKLSKIENVGQIIDKLVSGGVSGISTPIFSVEDETQLKTQAYEQAVKDARSKAEKLAESFGVKLGKPNQIAVDYYDIQPRLYYNRLGDNGPYATSSVQTLGTFIMPNYVTKQTKVDVTFEILNFDKK